MSNPSPSVTLVYFSPTHTTKKTLEAISRGITILKPIIIDFTRPENRKNPIKIETDLCIVGAPVYSDGIPKLVKGSLRFFDSSKTRAIAVVLYGNREYGMALKEIVEILTIDQIKVIAAGAFIGEHSYSIKPEREISLAIDRPDEEDISIAEEFGNKILDEYNKNSSVFLSVDDVPGKSTLPKKKETDKNKKAIEKPKKSIYPSSNDSNLCNDCKICVDSCPTEAIKRETLEIDYSMCILCMACVKLCPKSARKIIFNEENYGAKMTKKFLNTLQNQRKEPKYVLARE
ncbi:MAG: 4Fe-4S dicluster domain-containing protein [archaeon]|nr:4Fe-4S dicluster domain-containing protein [archaeon]